MLCFPDEYVLLGSILPLLIHYFSFIFYCHINPRSFSFFTLFFACPLLWLVLVVNLNRIWNQTQSWKSFFCAWHVSEMLSLRTFIPFQELAKDLKNKFGVVVQSPRLHHTESVIDVEFFSKIPNENSSHSHDYPSLGFWVYEVVIKFAD